MCNFSPYFSTICLGGDFLERVRELYESYEKFIFKYLYGLTLDFHLAEELTQETFFQVVRSFHRFRGDSHVSTWIYKIARNVYSQHYKKTNLKTSSINEEVYNIPDKSTPEDEYSKKEQSEMIENCLKQIPKNQREVLWLRDWQGISYEEIAIITNHSLSWVKVNIHRGRVAFKKIYSEGGNING